MQYSQAHMGRIFVLRLEDGDIVHEVIEQFAREKDIERASLIAVGGADEGSRFVVGPEDGKGSPVSPLHLLMDNVHEIAGVGTIFPDQKGRPMLHMHMACGRQSSTVVGCIRQGVKVWHIMEVILFELIGGGGKRVFDPETGFELLSLGPSK